MLHTTVLSEVRRHLILHCSTQQQETSGRGEKASFRHLRKQGALLLQAVHYQQIFQDCDRSLVPCKIHVTAVLINLTHSIFQKQFYDTTYSTTCSSIESVHKQYLTAPYIACICSKESYHNQVTCETVRTPLVSYTRKDCRHLRTMFSFFFKKKNKHKMQMAPQYNSMPRVSALPRFTMHRYLVLPACDINMQLYSRDRDLGQRLP